jgi:uncharacterized protein YcbK (DUF882 family)
LTDFSVESFGEFEGEKVSIYTLKNANDIEVNITNYGGIVTSAKVPDKNGKFDDVVLGYNTLQAYINNNPYFGSIVGRYGNRIGNAEFALGGKKFTLVKNIGENNHYSPVFSKIANPPRTKTNRKDIQHPMPRPSSFSMMFRCTAMLFLILLKAAPVGADPSGGLFFIMGDGKLHIKSDRTGQETEVDLITADGLLNDKGFSKVDELFGFPTLEKGEHISPRLIFMLDHFSDQAAPGKMIHLESGYRSPEYNQKLKEKGGIVAKTSLHMDGMAADLYIPGVNGKMLWELIRSEECCGIGHYGGETIHLDSGRPRFWESDTADTTTGSSDYNRRIYLSTDRDRYRGGDTLRLSFSSVSDFGFGVAPSVAFVSDDRDGNIIETAPIEAETETDCRMIEDRKASRFLTVTLPPDIRAGKYRLRINFCRIPFPQMPGQRDSNKIEIW